MVNKEPLHWLKRVDFYKDDWLRIAASFVGNDIASDVVQESYLKLHKYASEEKLFFKDGGVNKSYMYLTIRSICFEILGVKKIILKEDVVELKREIDTDVDEKVLAFNRLCDKIDKEVMTWRWYDSRLFMLYKDSPMSLRKIAKETGISWVSIHYTIKNCKAIIHEKFKEDYEDYINGDYELI